MSDYQGKSVAELKAVLASRGLKTTGNKAVLIERLVESDASEAGARTEEAGEGEKIVKITLENVGNLTMEERLELRRKKFGTDTLQYKIEQRKNRFGTNNKPNNRVVTITKP